MGPTQRVLALEQRLPWELLHELQNRMFDSEGLPRAAVLEKKSKFVQMRVEVDHQRRLMGSSHATLERPGGMFDGGYGVFGEVGPYGEEVEEGPEAVAPLMAALASLQATPDPKGGVGPLHRLAQPVSYTHLTLPTICSV